MTDPERSLLHHTRSLLGLRASRGGNRATSRRSLLPVGVAARLALVLAASQDPAVLCGGLTRGTEADRAQRADLLVKATRAAVTLDVTGPVRLPVRCPHRVHLLELASNDDVDLLSHPELDPVLEQIAAALGGTLLPCVRELVDAGRSHAAPADDPDGPRADPIGAGELLAFVRLSREWVRAGFDLTACAAALDRGLRHRQLAPYLALGIDLVAATTWGGTPAAEALRWTALGFTAEDAAEWTGLRRTLAEAEALSPAGRGPVLARWARVAGSAVGTQALADWAHFGEPVGVWGELASRGVQAAEVTAWLGEGFSPVEILRYAHLHVPLAVAVGWRDQGFTGFQATSYLGVQMTLPDAEALRGLPVHEVVRAWPRARSVPGVLSALAPLVEAWAEDTGRGAPMG